MVRGRKPRATAVKKRTGSFTVHPGRENKEEPKPREGSPKKPNFIKADPVASDYWDHLESVLGDTGVLTVAERTLLAMCCTAYSEWMDCRKHIKQHGVCTSTANGGDRMSPQTQQYNKTRDHLLKLITEIGLTPSSRARLKVPGGEKEEDPFQGLLDRFANSRNNGPRPRELHSS